MPRLGRGGAALILVLSLGGGGFDLAGQRPPSAGSPDGRLQDDSRSLLWPAFLNSPALALEADRTAPESLAPTPGRAGLRSLLLPGSGQLAQGRRRGWAFVGIELIGLAAYLDRGRDARDLRDQYRDFAWVNGRVQGALRIDGDFDYYEALSKWDRSGAFDSDSGVGGVQPEVDPSAFNGLIWLRATGIFSVDPSAGPGDARYDRALAYYNERAYGTQFLWDWTGVPGSRSAYAALIQSSDDRFRQASHALGLVLVNHLVSAIDAYVSARSGLLVETRIVPGSGGLRVSVVSSVRGQGP